MTTHVIAPDQLAAAMRREAKKVPRLVERAAMRAAQRGKARLVAVTDEKGITDMGQYKNSFHVSRGAAGEPAVLFNDAPMAGVIELGARPHPVSAAGLKAIAEWALRKLDVADEREAMRVARAIARKLAAEGQEGRFVFSENQALLVRYWREEFERALRNDRRPA